ncbi:hypothetical protein HDV00_000915, partial [Rhizophlyctis rosea]
VATFVKNGLKGRLGEISEVFKEIPGGKILETWEEGVLILTFGCELAIVNVYRPIGMLGGYWERYKMPFHVILEDLCGDLWTDRPMLLVADFNVARTDADEAVSVRPGLKSGCQAWERESLADLEKAGLRHAWRELHPKGRVKGFTYWMPERNARVFHQGMRSDIIYYRSIPKHVGIQLKGCERFDLGGSDQLAVVAEFRVFWRNGMNDYRMNLLRAYHLGEPEFGVGNGKTGTGGTVEAVAGKKGGEGLDLRGLEEVKKICGANGPQSQCLPIVGENLDSIRRIFAGHHEEFVKKTEMLQTFTGVTEMKPHLKMEKDDKGLAPKYRGKSPAETQLEIEYRGKMIAAGKLEPTELPILTAGITVIAWKGDEARLTF